MSRKDNMGRRMEGKQYDHLRNRKQNGHSGTTSPIRVESK